VLAEASYPYQDWETEVLQDFPNAEFTDNDAIAVVNGVETLVSTYYPHQNFVLVGGWRNDMYDSIYTHRERTVANHTIGEALESAKRRLIEKDFGGYFCVDSISNRSLHDKITLEELNNIAERIVEDSLYYD